MGQKPKFSLVFDARITHEIEKDDGSDTQLFLKIEGKLCTGEKLPAITMSAQEFESMSWILHRWGTRAWYSGMPGTERHLRSAITHISKDYHRKHLFSHTGWIEHDGKWVFLTEAGAIGEAGVVDSLSVDLTDNNLTDFELPAPEEDLDVVDSIKNCFSLLKLAPEHITFPLFAAIFRAALGEALPITFALFIVGATGTRKSEISGVAQSFYGKKFNGKNLPCNWSSSANALERITFQTKDCLNVVDDYVPGENPRQMNAIADRVFRGLGNQAGRQRMNADLTLRKEYYPRSLIVGTAEDSPCRQSLTGRMLLLELAEGDVDLDVLTDLQQLALNGDLSAIMYCYIKWLAPNIDKLKKDLVDHKASLRIKAVEAEKTHTRTPDIIADPYIGFESFCSFALSQGAISQEEVNTLQSKCWDNVLLAASKQQSQQNEGDPCIRFRDLLKAAFVMGKAHLGSFHAGKPPSNPGNWGWEGSVNQFGAKEQMRSSSTTYLPKGTLIGWEDGQNVYLNSDAAMKIIEEVGGRERAVTTSAKMLRLRLAERGFLIKGSNGELTIRKRIRGERRSVMCLHKDFFNDNESGDDESDILTSSQVPLFQPIEDVQIQSAEIVDPTEKLKEAFENANLKNNFFQPPE